MLKVDLDGGCLARTGSMVAYQGQVQVTALGSGGAAKWLKSKLTGEGVPLMKLSGNGDVMLADRAKEIHLIDLDQGEAISVNGSNVLAFESSVSYDVQMVQGVGMLSAAGMFNCVLSGPGRIAITTDGYPLVLTADQPTYVDPQAAICWSTGLQTGYHRADQLGLGTLLGRNTGEAFTMSLAVKASSSSNPPNNPHPAADTGGGCGWPGNCNRVHARPDDPRKRRELA